MICEVQWVESKRTESVICKDARVEFQHNGESYLRITEADNAIVYIPTARLNMWKFRETEKAE